MVEFHTLYKQSKTTDMMRIINKVLYLCGLSNFWIEPAPYPQRFVRKYDVISSILHITNCGYTLLLLSAFLTQKNLTPKQQSDRVVDLASPFTHFYCLVFLYHRPLVREILYKLMVGLKEQQNDKVVEQQMIRKLKMYLAVYLGSGFLTLSFFGVHGAYQKIHLGTPFITIVTAWPDVRSVSTMDEVARVVFYGYWWVSFTRISGSYIILLSMLIGLSKQYKNLQCYF